MLCEILLRKKRADCALDAPPGAIQHQVGYKSIYLSYLSEVRHRTPTITGVFKVKDEIISVLGLLAKAAEKRGFAGLFVNQAGAA